LFVCLFVCLFVFLFFFSKWFSYFTSKIGSIEQWKTKHFIAMALM